jgi:hypothetical protein
MKKSKLKRVFKKAVLNYEKTMFGVIGISTSIDLLMKMTEGRDFCEINEEFVGCIGQLARGFNDLSEGIGIREDEIQSFIRDMTEKGKINFKLAPDHLFSDVCEKREGLPGYH